VRYVSSVNKKIMEAVEKSTYPKQVKELIKALLVIELRHFGDKSPRYAEDYDRNIKRLAGFKETEEDK
jgi:hypothetical protein